MALPLISDLAYIFNADEFGVTVTRITANFGAKTTFVGTGTPVIGVDVTGDGKWIVATYATRHFLSVSSLPIIITYHSIPFSNIYLFMNIFY